MKTKILEACSLVERALTLVHEDGVDNH